MADKIGSPISRFLMGFGSGITGHDYYGNLVKQKMQQQKIKAQEEQFQQEQKIAEQEAKRDLQRFIIKQNLQPFSPESMTGQQLADAYNKGQRVYGLGGKQYLKQPDQSKRLGIQSKKLTIEGKKLLNKQRRKKLTEMPQDIQKTLNSGLNAIAKGEGKPEQFYWELMSNPKARKYQKKIKDILNLSKTSLEASDDILEFLRGE